MTPINGPGHYQKKRLNNPFISIILHCSLKKQKKVLQFIFKLGKIGTVLVIAGL